MSSLHPVRAHFSGLARALLAFFAVFGLLVGLSPTRAMADDEPVDSPYPSISGKVTGSSGPVENAQVCAYRTSESWAYDCAWTLVDGSYELDDLSASTFRVKVTESGYVPTWYATPASVAAAGSAAVLDLSTEPTRTGVDIQLIKGATVTGQVTLDGVPMSYANVCLPDGETCASTGSSGPYTIQVPPGSVKLTATWRSNWNEKLKGSATLTVEDGQPYAANIALAPGTGLSGTVTVDPDADGNGYATVYSVTADGDLNYADEHYLTESLAGPNTLGYTFRALSPGKYVVMVTADGYASARVGSVANPLTVSPNGILPVGNVVLTRLAPGNLAGKVVDSSGKALEDVTVSLFSTAMTQTAADGTFTLNSVAAGLSTRLSLSKTGYVTQTIYATPRASRTTTLPAVHLFKPSSISGTVTDSAGHAAAGVSVYLSGPGNTYASMETSPDGTYSFTDLPSGRYELYVNSSGDLMSASKEVSLGEGKSLTGVTLVRTAPATISGTLVGADHSPVEGWVSLFRGDDMDDEYEYDSTGTDGVFSFDWLPAGTYTIRAGSDDYQATWLGDVTSADNARPIAIGSGGNSTDNTITLQPRGGTTLSGTVKTAEGSTASDVHVALATRETDGGDWDYDDYSDDTGKYTISHLADGDYFVVVDWDGTSICGPSYTRQCTPSAVTMAGQDKSVDVTLPNLGSVSGSVNGPAGVTGWVDIYLTDAAGREIVYQELDSGDESYRLQHIPYGTYKLTLEPEDGATVTKTIVVDGDETLDLVYSAGYSISGTVSTVRAEGWITVRAVDVTTGDTMASTDIKSTGAGDFRYSISGLPAGDYRLFLNTNSQSVWYPSEKSQKTATTIKITDADRSGFDFALTTAGVARVSGRLILPAGLTVDNPDDYPELRFAKVDNDYDYYPTIAEDGSYSLLLPLGSYQVTVFRSEELGTVQLQQNVQVTANQTLDLTLALGGSLSGRVVDSDGVGIGNAAITATSADRLPATAYSDPWGYWTMSGVSPNANTLRISADGYVTVDGGPVSVVQGQDRDTGSVTLAAAGQLRVRLPYLNGYPRVTIVATDAAGKELARSGGYADNDSYWLSDLPVDQPLRIRFEGKAIATEWWKDAASLDAATPVTLNADSVTTISPTLALSTAKPGTVSGTITNVTGQDGTVWITAVDDDDAWTTTAAVDGSYSLELPPGTDYKVRAGLCLGLWMGESECVGGRVLTWYGGSSKDDASLVGVTSERSTEVNLTIGDSASTFTAAPKPTVSGQPTVGSTLAATAGTWDPAPDLAYQWLRGAHEINGATGTSYTLVTADADSTISVKVTATKPGYQTTSRTSDATLTVLDFTSGTGPAIAGTAQVGETLTASDGSWPVGGTLARQWKSGGAVVGTDSSTYIPVAGDVGKTITVTVTWSRTGYSSVSRTSSAYGPVVAAPSPSQPTTPAPTPDKPFVAAPTPTISIQKPAKAIAVGATLTTDLGSWAPAPDALAVQWLRGGAPIAGATKASYKVAAADAGFQLSVRVTASKAGYETVAKDSSKTKAVPYLGKTKAATPKISGTAKVGKTLKAKAGTWKPKGYKFTYQWFRSGVAISGATKTSYKLTAADKGKKLTVKVTGKNPGYQTVTKASKATAKVK